MFNGHEFGFFTGGFMWFFWILLIILVAWLGKAIIPEQPSQSAAKSALDILNERYAKGEIDQQEYEQKRHQLDS